MGYAVKLHSGKGGKVILLASSVSTSTFNVASKYPAYNTLTASNFILEYSSASGNATFHDYYSSYSSLTVYGSATFGKSYNPQTGILGIGGYSYSNTKYDGSNARITINSSIYLNIYLLENVERI